ncbi:DoxX-like protein [Micromonospora pisi]|uniref:DoxX-like protein n=1 Tax=Micromonospora pisi TaxID=589240 RepID=A0A495JGB5_9ACTN|nr:DoxX family protein [Micromonospora pisi]RKR87089.1 DoxX-like protein [Micromonospora pisi]
MSVAYVALAILLSVMLLGSAQGKLTKNEKVVQGLSAANVPLNWYPPLATIEIIGAAGLLIGIFIGPLGVAAAAGVTLYFVGAVIAHLRAGDTSGVAAPATILLIAVATLVVRILSL